MSNAENMKISDWAKQNQVNPEVVSRLLQAKGVKVNSFFSVVKLEEFESIRVSALAEQERIDKRSHSKKGAQNAASSSNAPASKAPIDQATSSKDVGGRKLKVTLKRPGSEDSAESRPAPIRNTAPIVRETPIVRAPVELPKAAVMPPTVAPVADSESPVSKAVQESVPPVSESSTSPQEPVVTAVVAPSTPTAPARPVAPMKATITGPTPEMLARIQKSREQQAQSRRPGPGGPNRGTGYTGSFGRSPQGGPGPARTSPGGPGAPGGAPRGPQGGNFNRGPGGFNRPAAPGNSAMADAMSGAGFQPPTANPAAGGSRPTNANKGGKPSGPSHKGGKGGKGGKPEQTREQSEVVRQSVNRVMASISKNPVKKTYRKEATEQGGSQERPVLKTSDFITVSELAGLMEVMPNKVIAKCMEMGMMVTINHRLDFETMQVLADEFGYDVELMDEYIEENLSQGEVEKPEDLKPRSPIVTVMGHVDHGKTSLLDYIRNANVVKGESGGITQHIGAYEVTTPAGNVTFLDTPGHEAFTAMRTRGSQVTDVIVLVVAADSQVMPQTIEVIELARQAKVPIVVAITKCDLPTANTDKIRADLANRGVEVDTWGGQTSCVEVSVRTGMGIDRLLETLALETEVLDLKANPNGTARGTVIESRLDAGKGAMATILVQNGTLAVGDIFVCGNASGRVRAMFDERGKPRKEAGPSTPAVVIGFDETPQAGDDLISFADEKTAREIASKRRQAARERELRARKHMSLEQVYNRKQSGEFSELNLIVKADVDGSAEAIAASLERLTNKEVKINIIRKAVGAIKEDDIMLATSADAVIIAFHLMPSLTIRELAEREGIEIRTYRIIYEILEDIQGVVEGMLKPVLREEVSGEAEIREVFKIPKIGLIAGCMVTSGAVDRESHVRVYRDGVELGITVVQSLKRHKDDAKEVKTGFECGIGLKGYENIQSGDNLIFFKEVKVARTLADVEADAAKAAVAKLDGKSKK